MTPPTPPPDLFDALPPAVQAYIQHLEARLAELEARLNQHSANSSKPPSSDGPHVKPARPRTPSSKRRGGQPGHPRHDCVILPPDHAVCWRKTSYGTDSETGSRFVERVLTVVATCRQQGRGVLEFLVKAVTGAKPSLLPAGA